MVSQRRSGASSFHHYDAVGNTRVLTNSAQTPTDTADYRAFGQPNASTGSTTNPFRWGGRMGYYRQADSADYWLRARIYRDLVARFLSQDPARLQANRYRFPGNNPVMLADPSGLQGCAHGPGGTCPHHGPSTQGWAPAGAGNGQGGHHPRRCEPQSGCQRRLTNDDWYIMCRCKEPDKRNWRCRCPHPEGWPRPPQEGMAQLVHVETCRTCGEAGGKCTCHFQLWRVPLRPPRRKWQVGNKIVKGTCIPCGGGGGGDGPDGDCDGNGDSGAGVVLSAVVGPLPGAQSDFRWRVCTGACEPQDLIDAKKEMARIQKEWGTRKAGAADYWYLAGLVEALAGLLAIGWFHAAEALSRFLDNSGYDLTVDVNDLYERTPDLQSMARTDKPLVRALVCRLLPGSYTLIDGYRTWLATPSGDWNGALGNIEVWPRARADVRCVGKTKSAEVLYEINLWDPYAWEEGGPYLELHKCGLAREFVQIGSTMFDWKFDCV